MKSWPFYGKNGGCAAAAAAFLLAKLEGEPAPPLRAGCRPALIVAALPHILGGDLAPACLLPTEHAVARCLLSALPCPLIATVHWECPGLWREPICMYP